MRIAIVLLTLAAAGCGLTGPSDDLTGAWTARSIGHFDLVGMTLHQSGDVITGTACATSAGVLYYKDVPVTGDYPNLQFTVSATQAQPCCQSLVGRVFKGKQDSTMDIVGSYGTSDLRFERSDASVCP
jgi:hypothetical protein